MEEMFEYLVPNQGFFKKIRRPKIIELYKSLDNFEGVVEDFKNAKSFLDDAIRIGQYYIFCKERISIFFIKDITEACFVVHGNDPTDEFGTINFIFRDGSEEKIYKTQEITVNRETLDFFSALYEKKIKTTVLKTR